MDGGSDLKPTRVHITGGAGSGKTTLARLLAAKLRVPLLPLDSGGYDAAAGHVLIEGRGRLLAGIESMPGWVIEGSFVGWAFLRSTHAWYASTRTRDDAYRVPPGTTGITHLDDTRALLRAYESKLMTCRTNHDVRRVRTRLADAHEATAQG